MKLAAGWEVGPKTKHTLLDPAKAPNTGAVQLTMPSMKLADDSEMTGVICLLSSGLQTNAIGRSATAQQGAQHTRGHQNDSQNDRHDLCGVAGVLHAHAHALDALHHAGHQLVGHRLFNKHQLDGCSTGKGAGASN